MDASVISDIIMYKSIVAIFAFFVMMMVIVWLMDIFSPRKSQRYRKLLTDMFVAGKIKKLAKEESINLADEEKNFNLWLKKKRLDYLDLDRTIEEEMKDKIANVETKKEEKKE